MKCPVSCLFRTSPGYLAENSCPASDRLAGQLAIQFNNFRHIGFGPISRSAVFRTFIVVVVPGSSFLHSVLPTRDAIPGHPFRVDLLPREVLDTQHVFEYMQSRIIIPTKLLDESVAIVLCPELLLLYVGLR